MVQIIDDLYTASKNHGILDTLFLDLVVLVAFVILLIIAVKWIWKKVKPMIMVYVKYEEEKNEMAEMMAKTTKELTELRSDMNDALSRIEDSIITLSKNDKIQQSTTADLFAGMLTDTCNRCIDRGFIKDSELQGIIRLYKTYSSEPLNGNSYIHILVDKCIALDKESDGTGHYFTEESIKELQKKL